MYENSSLMERKSIEHFYSTYHEHEDIMHLINIKNSFH